MSEPYREHRPDQTDAYALAWSKLRRRRDVLRGAAVVGFLVVVPVIAVRAQPGSPLEALALGWIVALSVARLAAAMDRPFRCPRCDYPFFKGILQALGRARACVHCGLLVGAVEPPEHPPGLAQDARAAPPASSPPSPRAS